VAEGTEVPGLLSLDRENIEAPQAQRCHPMSHHRRGNGGSRHAG
jgi:hypothetical protein